MPLILISGYPCSGKTYRSRQLVDNFNAKIQSSEDAKIKNITVHQINDESLGIERTVYKEAKTEKNARATAYSAIKRVLGPKDIVVADGLNYIKGYRYQLYCEAKAVRSTSCVVHIGTPVSVCRDVNNRILQDGEASSGYEADIFENLVYRYEEPNGMSRWDSPLFTVLADDATPPFDKIWEALIGVEGETKAVRPNAATVTAPVAEANYLYELDKITQEVVNCVLEWQKDHAGEGGGEIAQGNTTISLPSNPISLPQLQRLRRQFISLNRQHQIPVARLREAFVEFLNDGFD